MMFRRNALGRRIRSRICGVAAGLALVVVTTGCVATTRPNVTDASAVASDEGILLLRVSQDDPHGRLLLQKHLGPPPQVTFQEENDRSPAGIKLVSVPAGTYAFRALERRGGFSRLQPSFRFAVEPGTITYIGDFFVTWNSPRPHMRIVDDERLTLDAARQLYPKVFDGKLRYRKAVAQPE